MSEFTDLKKYGLDVDAALRYTGDSDKYILGLSRFYNAYDNNSAKIKGYYDDKDYENYSILVHSLKSNARMIGALDLGDMCEKLQYASADNDVDVVDMYHDVMMLKYQELRDIIKPYALSVNDKRGQDTKVIEELLSKLKDALTDYDHKAAMSLAGKLSDTSIDITKKTKLNDIIDNINEFEYDKALDIAKQL